MSDMTLAIANAIVAATLDQRFLLCQASAKPARAQTALATRGRVAGVLF